MDWVILKDCEEIFQRNIPWEKLYGKTVLITGAYGMLASYMTDMLIYLNEYHGAGIKIIALVRSENKCRECFGEYTEKPYFKINTSSLDLPIDIDDKIDFIVHAASLASPQHYSLRPIDVITPNAVGTYNLLNLAYRNRAEGFLLFSTGSVYGKVNEADFISEEMCGLVDPLNIHSCYNESKRVAETYCKAFFVQRHISTMIVRIWHTYSPTMDYKNDPRVFSSFVNDIVNHRDIVMKSDGLAKRSFCYITDALAGFFLVLLMGVPGEAYNVCNENEFYSILEFAKIMTNIRPEYRLSVIRKQRDINDAYLENTSANFIPPSSKKLRNLGWETKISLREGFTRVLDYIEKKDKKCI